MLTSTNYKKGFLIDHQWMGGVTESPEEKDHFVAYVLNQATGHFLGHHLYPTLPMALKAINSIDRSWEFESTSSCGTAGCKKGNCKNCSSKKCKSRNEAES